MSESRGDELVAKAEKKLKGFSLFGNKYEDASEILEKAANQYKLAKAWRKAGETYLKLAECHNKLDAGHDAASCYVNASHAYKKVCGGGGGARARRGRSGGQGTEAIP